MSSQRKLTDSQKTQLNRMVKLGLTYEVLAHMARECVKDEAIPSTTRLKLVMLVESLRQQHDTNYQFEDLK